MKELGASYEPGTFEIPLYEGWESAGLFKPSGKGEAYSIFLPPPNVTGTLHMGHAFQQTLMDALIRYHRMRGFDTLWQMGSDHAGIATEMVVSRNLAASGSSETRNSLGREKFIEKVWEWKNESGDTIERQMRRLGSSGDWSRSTFTMDDGPVEAVREVFVRLFEKDLIYRGKRLVNWDPVLQTAISDLEVVNEEEDGFLWSISYPLSDGSGSVTVATTRPETLLGDTAVMVHPEDERYTSLLGKTVVLPVTGREVPVIADDYVDREFGTGVVKVTPAHDFNDYQVGVRHSLPLLNVLTPTAHIVDGEEADAAGIPAKYRGLDRFDARKLMLEDLEASAQLIETKDHKLQVPRGDRSGQIIEPYLTDQWFVRMDEFARRGMALVSGDDAPIKFVPANWINTYRHWMENIQDWTISRQLWWGHRIPAWYDEDGKVYVGRTMDEVRAKYSLSEDVVLREDEDVLETWFSSALWPFSTLGWPRTEEMAARGYDRYLPSSVLVTGFDIIFFWVARMIIMTDEFTGEVPFKDVFVTGLVRDKDGSKMSKSKGNIIDPLDIIDGISFDDLLAKRTTGLMQPRLVEKVTKMVRKDYPNGMPKLGVDALRFTLVALAGHGRDVKFDMDRAEGYKNFLNKLWNATRFVLMNTSGASFVGAPTPVTDAEKWILSELSRVSAEAAEHFASYRFDLLAASLYDFAWNSFCDWFLELSKPALAADAPADAAASTRHTLLYVLDQLLRLLHPLIPFVTEELWQQVAPRLGLSGSLMLAPYPVAAETYPAAVADVEWLQDVVTALRRVRSELNVPPSRTVPLLVSGASASDVERLAQFDASVKFLCKISAVDSVSGETPPAAAAVVGDMTLLVPLEGLVDLDAERARLDKELKRVTGEIAKCQGKLASETFVANAPAAVVEQERKRLVDWQAQLEGLSAQRAKLA